MLRDRLMALVQPVVEGLGYELWDLEYAPGRGDGLVRVYIDATAGVTVDDCERVSRAVSGVLDESDPVPGHYTLEVSSPGLDRPLRHEADYRRFAGRLAKVVSAEPIDGQSAFSGRLRGVEDGHVVLEEGRRMHRVPLGQIKRAQLVVEF